MATPRRRYFLVADSTGHEDYDNDLLASLVRLMGHMHERWARDGQTAEQACRCEIGPSDLERICGKRRRDVALKCAERWRNIDGISVERVGDVVVITWPKFAEFQGLTSRPRPEADPKPAPSVTVPVTVPVPDPLTAVPVQEVAAHAGARETETARENPPSSDNEEPDEATLRRRARAATCELMVREMMEATREFGQDDQRGGYVAIANAFSVAEIKELLSELAESKRSPNPPRNLAAIFFENAKRKAAMKKLTLFRAPDTRRANGN